MVTIQQAAARVSHLKLEIIKSSTRSFKIQQRSAASIIAQKMILISKENINHPNT